MTESRLVASFTDSFGSILNAAEAYRASVGLAVEFQAIEDPANLLRVQSDMVSGVTPVKVYVIAAPNVVMGILGEVAKRGHSGLSRVEAYEEEKFYANLVERQHLAAPHSAFEDAAPRNLRKPSLSRDLPSLVGFIKGKGWRR